MNMKADALFFLHTARLDRRMNDRERGEKKRFECAGTSFTTPTARPPRSR